MIYLYFFLLVISFAILFKSADFFVSGASNIAVCLNIPKMVIGIVLVSLATTAPEFAVSVQAAFLNHPEIALGNAIGSVICDDGIALALAAIIAPVAIVINCKMLKIAGVFLLSIDIIGYLMAKNGTVGREEGAFFVILLVAYFWIILKSKKIRTYAYSQIPDVNSDPELCELPLKTRLKKPILLFSLGLIGVILTSRIVLESSIKIAEHFNISETIIGLTVIAIGTSLPEISTCITAALKQEGEIAVGNIIGADILNVLWIIGVSAMVNPITVDKDIINFSFPFMILIV
ncbi:MAG: calcium/sodium antiporter, partial [Candidatus Aminicenantes bacterium]|nr:calcium/sodium antiporter [Candidatus Aminicenantes bacterium]